MQIYSLFIAVASVSRCPDGFAAGLCATMEIAFALGE